MSYTLPLHDLLHFYLNEFYDEYNTRLTDGELHQRASYFTHSTKNFVRDKLPDIINDPIYQDYLDDEVVKQTHTKFTILCNAALSELIYTYIIENY